MIAGHRCSQHHMAAITHRPDPLQRFFIDLSKRHYNHARSHHATAQQPFQRRRNCFLFFSLDELQSSSPTSQSCTVIFAIALPTDPKHQIKSHQSKNNHSQTNKENVSVVPSRFFHSRRCIGQLIVRLKRLISFLPFRLAQCSAAVMQKEKHESKNAHPTAERQLTIPRKEQEEK